MGGKGKCEASRATGLVNETVLPRNVLLARRSTPQSVRSRASFPAVFYLCSLVQVFSDAWLACLRLPLPPGLYRRLLLFLPEHVIPYMPSPVRLADFLTEAYGRGGVQAVLALDALFLLMQVGSARSADDWERLGVRSSDGGVSHCGPNQLQAQCRACKARQLLCVL